MSPPLEGRVHAGFSDVVVRYSDLLDCSTDVAWGVDADLRIVYLNRGWFDALERAGAPEALRAWTLGRSVLSAISGQQRAFYAEAFARVQATERPWEHRYLCPTPERQRTFWMRVDPVGGRRLLVVTGVAVDEPAPEGVPFVAERYRDHTGMVVQCGHCRRVRSVDNQTAWDWVRELVARPAKGTSHGLCPACLGYYFPV